MGRKTHDQVANRWMWGALGGEGKNFSNHNMFSEGDRIFSYGHHFELARVLRKPRRHTRKGTFAGEPTAFLLNGDTYSNTTSSHQSAVRAAVSVSSLPAVIIPYSVLEASGIDMDSIRILDLLEPRNVTTEHNSTVRDPAWIEREDGRLMTSTHWNAGEVEEQIEPDGTISYTWYTTRHWLGEALIEATVPYTVAVKCKDCGGTGHGYPRVTAVTFEENPWIFRCGNCSRGRVVRYRKRTAKFLSGFDRGEARQSYFFTELPKTDATDIEAALEALKPPTVKLAEQMGRHVLRQGDIFAVPVLNANKRSLTKAGATFAKRGNLLGTNHEGTEVAYLPDGRTLVRGALYHHPQWRRPDHARVTLTKGIWHLTVKNTVPMSA